MKKLLVLIPFFVLTACGVIDINLGEDASAQNIGGGGSSNANCQCSNHDGTRLKANWIVGEDGSRIQSNSWFDSEFGDDCEFQSFSNGEMRCVPPAPTLNLYIDSNCTIPTFMIESDCDTIPKYVRIERREADACGSKMMDATFYGIDKTEYKGVLSLYAIGPDGQCGNAGPSSGNVLRAVFPVKDISYFVKAAEGVGF